MAIMAVLFIIFQGLMGAAAVVWGHSDIVLALHFGISAISFATVVLLTVLAFEDGRRSPAPQVTKGFRNYLIFVLAYCYAAFTPEPTLSIPKLHMLVRGFRCVMARSYRI